MIPAIAPVGGILRQPTDIAGCVSWFDAADSSTITQSSGVTQWNDKSSSSFGVLASGVNKPSYQTAVLNGKNVVRFDGTNDYMTNGSATLLRSVAGWSMFCVANCSNFTTTRVPFSVASTAGNARAYISSAGVGDGKIVTGFRRLDADGLAGFPAIAGPDVFSSTFKTIASVCDFTTPVARTYVNGSQIGADVTPSTGTTSNTGGTLFVGSYPSVGSTYFLGDIAEAILFNSALSSAQRIRVEAYLKAKWGL